MVVPAVVVVLVVGSFDCSAASDYFGTFDFEIVADVAVVAVLVAVPSDYLEAFDYFVASGWHSDFGLAAAAAAVVELAVVVGSVLAVDFVVAVKFAKLKEN